MFVVTLWAAITLNFVLPRLMPGSPVDAALGKLASSGVPITNAQRRAVEIELGVPHASWFTQYWDYLTNLVQFKFGKSYSFPSETVAHTISNALPWTLVLVGVTTIFAFVVGTLLGDAFKHSVLPALTLAITTLSGWVFGMRNNMINTLGEDYVTFAEANGLRQRTVALRYAARNALLPNVTAFGLSLGLVVSGSILTEYVFGYPGLGYLMANAISNRDYPLLQALFLVITVSVLIANFLVDSLYTWLDPRVRR